MEDSLIEIEFKEKEFKVVRYNDSEKYGILLYSFCYSKIEDVGIEEFDDEEYGSYILFDPDTVFPFLVKHLIEQYELKYYVDEIPEMAPYIRKYKIAKALGK